MDKTVHTSSDNMSPKCVLKYVPFRIHFVKFECLIDCRDVRFSDSFKLIRTAHLFIMK